MTATAARAPHLPTESSGGELYILTAPVPAVPVDRFAAVFEPGGLLLWDPGPLDADGWSFAGVGEALRVEAQGERRAMVVRDLAQRALSRITERRQPGADHAPPLRLFGGLSFRPSDPDGPWTGFAQASFVLPRWLYGRRGDDAFLRVVVRHEDLGDAETLVQEISSLIAIAESGPTAPLNGHAGGARLEELGLEAWSWRINEALAAIRAGRFEKVVAARRSRLAADRNIDVASLLSRVGTAQPDSARFAMARAGAVFLGATPERLVARRGSQIQCDALAGSRPREGDGDTGAQRLLASAKDLREHAPVVAGIRSALTPFCRSITAEATPRVRTLRTVHHLWTPIAADLSHPVHVLDLVDALHPTPAVSGLPRAPAMEWIAAHEPEGRGWYASPIGWFDAEGNGTFFVAIRSALVRQREAWLFAGGGIVEGSDPMAEYQETALKQNTMLSAIGFSTGVVSQGRAA